MPRASTRSHAEKGEHDRHQQRKQQEKKVDKAVEMTFPASDPIAVYMDDIETVESPAVEMASH